MIKNLNRKININEIERERYSSFVVDLRKTVPVPTKKESKIEIKRPRFSLDIKPKTKNSLDLESLKENFSLENKINLKEKISALKNYLSSARRKILKSTHKKIKLPQISISFKKTRKHWLDEIEKQHKLFNKKFILNKSSKLEIAESKVLWYRSILSFTIVLILIIIPLKLLSYFELLDISTLESKVMNKSKGAMASLMAAAGSISEMDFQKADAHFSEASDGFLRAQEDLSVISDSLLLLASLSNDPKIKLAAESKKFLEAGALSSSLGRNLVLATDSLFSNTDTNFLFALESFSGYGEMAVRDAKQLSKIIDSINEDNLPLEYREQFILLSSQAKLLSENLESFVETAIKTKEILGLTRDKRYLLIFQNNSELRASGGFLGSYALVDLSGGKIKNLEVPGGGSYDTEGSMIVKVKAPEALWPLNPLWHFWDANWWPDWETTSKNLMWFYEKSNGPTVDGVISFTPTVVERLLEITGPIDLTAEYGLVIDSQNFWETVQKVVEHKNLKTSNPAEVASFVDSKEAISSSIPLEQGLDQNSDNKPKKIIGDLMAKILEVLPSKLNKDNLLKIITLFEESMGEKQIMFYFKDPILQAEAVKRNWAGEVKDTTHDYLMVVNTNIAGQKSDRKITEKIYHQSEISADGKIVNSVKISRTHNGVKNEALTGVRNVNWVRVYVPQGSRLISAQGFVMPDFPAIELPDSSWEDSDLLKNEREAIIDASGLKIYSENGKTVYAGWAVVDPGQTIDLYISYELPFNFYNDVSKGNIFLSRLNKILNPKTHDLWPYSLLVQKQPGAKPSEFNSRLSTSRDIEMFWSHPENLQWVNGWDITEQINTDKYYSVLLNKIN